MMGNLIDKFDNWKKKNNRFQRIVEFLWNKWEIQV